MNAQIKAEWVAALRSGDYAQGTGALRRDGRYNSNGYCCLGVLADLCLRHDPDAGRWGEASAGGDRMVFEWDGDDSAEILPARLAEAIGCDSSPRVHVSLSATVHGEPLRLPDEPADSTERELASLNDDGHSFAEIANLIEATETL